MTSKAIFEQYALENTTLTKSDFEKDDDGNYLDIDVVYRFSGWNLGLSYMQKERESLLAENAMLKTALNDIRDIFIEYNISEEFSRYEELLKAQPKLVDIGEVFEQKLYFRLRSLDGSINDMPPDGTRLYILDNN